MDKIKIENLKKLLWITTLHQTWQLRRNRKSLRKIQTTNTKWERNRKLNRTITSKEVEPGIKNLPSKEIPDSDDFTNIFYQTFKVELNSNQTLPKKSQRREFSETHFIRPALPWYQRQKIPGQYPW